MTDLDVMPRPQTASQRWLVPGTLAAGILALDQLTKAWVVQALGPEPGLRQIFLIGDWFSLVYIQNTGVAFGLFQNLSPLFTITSLVISAGVIYAYLFYLPNHSIWVQTSVGLILGGALGNVIDRLIWGYVVDFIRVGWWPTFNVADSCISIGVVMLAGYLLLADDIEPAPPGPRDDALLRELLSQDIAPVEQEASQQKPGG